MGLIIDVFTKYFIVIILAGLAYHMYSPYWSTYLYLSGTPIATVVLLSVAKQVSLGVFRVPAGLLSDRYGRRSFYTVGLMFSALGLLLLALFPSNIPLLTLAFITMGSGEAFRLSSLEAWVADECRKRGSGNLLPRIIGKANALFDAIGVLCGVVGGLLSSHLILLPIIASLMATLTTALVALSLPENYGAGSSALIATKRAFSYILSSRSLQLYMLGYILFLSTFEYLISTWTKISLSIGLSKEWIGPLYSVLIASCSIGGLVFALLAKRFNYRTIGIFSLPLSAISFLMIGLGNDLFIVLTGLILFEFSLNMVMSYLITLRNELVNSSYRATLISLVGTISMLLTEPIVSTLGLLSAFINTSMTYSMCALLIVLSATLLHSVSLEH
jgi:MFS family permease